MRFIVIPPEQIARARALYEGTSVPVHDIAAMLGLGVTTFLKRVKLWGWKPRNRRLADLADPAGGSAGDEDWQPSSVDNL